MRFISILYKALRIWKTADAMRRGGGKRMGGRIAARAAGTIIRKLIK